MIAGAFAKWCELRGVARIPAPPAMVAAFVAECAPLGVEQVWQALQEVSAEHASTGYPDPTLGGSVAQAMNAVSKIEPPRSWPKAVWPQFYRLPYDLQLVVRDRENDRDRAVSRARNAARAADKGMTNGTKSAAAAY